MAGLPMQIFPGFTSYGLVSSSVREIATVFNAEGLDALQQIPEEHVAWADVGTRTTQMTVGTGKIPVRLTSMLGFEPMEGERHYHQMNVAATEVRVNPWQLNLEWPIQFTGAGAPAGLANFYGVQGIAGDVVQHARAAKADLVASVIIGGMTNSVLGMTAKAYTLAQPGYSTGLPLFSDGSTSGASTHYSNPLDASSAKFANLYLGAGKLTDAGVMGKCFTDMIQVPHPSKQNMRMGLQVTDFIGGTNMLIPFLQLQNQVLSLQTTTSPGNLAAATTNIFNPDLIKGAQLKTGPQGILPWRFWIAPQLDAHPYLVANPTAQMWLTVAGNRASGAWCEIGAPTKDFTPFIKLLGEGSEEAIKTRKVRLIGDLDCGAAAGLPHFVKLYLETTPTG